MPRTIKNHAGVSEEKDFRGRRKAEVTTPIESIKYSWKADKLLMQVHTGLKQEDIT